MIVDGSKIESVSQYYEQLLVCTSDGKKYFFSIKELLPVLSEFIFEAETKKTRTWLHPVTPDVDLLYEQDRYPK
jgi:hypothetical protein